MTLDELLERDDMNEAVVYPELQEAIIGVVSRFGQEDIICYDYDKCIEIFMNQGMTYNEAIEHFSNNTIGTGIGERTPCFLERITV